MNFTVRIYQKQWQECMAEWNREYGAFVIMISSFDAEQGYRIVFKTEQDRMAFKIRFGL